MLVKKENLDGPFAHREAFHYGRLVSVFVKLELEKRGHRLVLYMTCCSVTILTVRLIWSFWLAMLEGGGIYTRLRRAVLERTNVRHCGMLFVGANWFMV